jgi:hypothetical protein
MRAKKPEFSPADERRAGLRIARVFRVARVVWLVREVGMKTLIDKVLHDRAGSALYTVLVLCVFVIQSANTLASSN